MDLAQFTALLAAAGIGGVIAAMVNAVANRRKLGNEATAILTNAAGGIVDRLDKDNAVLRERLDKNEKELKTLRDAQELSDRRDRAAEMIQERWRWHMDRWHRYSSRLADELRALGGTIEDPPPMWPEPVLLEDIELPK
jgi:hypothetical protein